MRPVAGPVGVRLSDPDRLYCGGTSPPDDPADTRRPSASVTTRALAIVERSFAIAPSTVTSSPIWRDLPVQPHWTSTLGLASSRLQLVTFPLSSLTSI